MNESCRKIWKTLEARARDDSMLAIESLFEQEPDRLARMCFEAAGLRVDTSKNLLSRETLRLLLELAEAAGLADAVESMFDGLAINRTEGRPVLHTALRAAPRSGPEVDGRDVKILRESDILAKIV